MDIISRQSFQSDQRNASTNPFLTEKIRLIKLYQFESDPIQESGKNSGGTSSFVCPENTAIVGRKHTGDEKGDTVYYHSQFAMNSSVGYQTSEYMSQPRQESGKDNNGQSEFICDADYVVNGRGHEGDENGNTWYTAVKLMYNNTPITVKDAHWSDWMQESGKNTDGESVFQCAAGYVITGRQHQGDENGNTRYQYSRLTMPLITVNQLVEQPLYLHSLQWTEYQSESNGQWLRVNNV